MYGLPASSGVVLPFGRVTSQGGSSCGGEAALPAAGEDCDDPSGTVDEALGAPDVSVQPVTAAHNTIKAAIHAEYLTSRISESVPCSY
jgi:hypothetical protein